MVRKIKKFAALLVCVAMLSMAMSSFAFAAANNEDTEHQSPIVKELTEKRTINSKTYLLENGNYLAEYYVKVSNWMNGDMGTLYYYQDSPASYFDGIRFNLTDHSDLYFKNLSQYIPRDLKVIRAKMHIFTEWIHSLNDNTNAVICAYTMKDDSIPQTIEERENNSYVLDTVPLKRNTDYSFDITRYLPGEGYYKFLGIGVSQLGENESVHINMIHPYLFSGDEHHPMLTIEYAP